MGRYTTGDKRVELSDIRDVPMRTDGTIPQGGPNYYSRIGLDPNRQLDLPNTDDVKKSELFGQIKKLSDAGFLTIVTPSLNAADDAVAAIAITDAP